MTGDLEYSSSNRSLNGRGIDFGLSEQVVDKYKQDNTQLVRASITNDAVIVSQLELAERTRKLIQDSGLNIKQSTLAGRTFYDILAMESGIDGWYSDNDKYLVVVNRGKVVVMR